MRIGQYGHYFAEREVVQLVVLSILSILTIVLTGCVRLNCEISGRSVTQCHAEKQEDIHHWIRRIGEVDRIKRSGTFHIISKVLLSGQTESQKDVGWDLCCIGLNDKDWHVRWSALRAILDHCEKNCPSNVLRHIINNIVVAREHGEILFDGVWIMSCKILGKSNRAEGLALLRGMTTSEKIEEAVCGVLGVVETREYSNVTTLMELLKQWEERKDTKTFEWSIGNDALREAIIRGGGGGSGAADTGAEGSGATDKAVIQ